MKKFLIPAGIFLILLSCASPEKKDEYIRVSQGAFTRGGEPYCFMGANYWQGMNLGAKTTGGNLDRLRRELDQMQLTGITNLRILALSEGPDPSPYRILPAVQDSVGVLKETILAGLDVLLDEMGKRNMTAIVVLNNYWPWSGGMAQYVNWNTGDSIQYPPPHGKWTWDDYQRYAARFYTIPKAVEQYLYGVKQVVERKNTVNGKLYKTDPVIMAWELANEPRGNNQAAAMQAWIDQSAAFIKGLDSIHLITTGAEGYTPAPESAGTDFVKMHSGKNIDYTVAHIWIQNWSWYDPQKHDSTYPGAVANMKAYLLKHAEEAKKMGKPFVLEEFGIMKDSGSFDPSAPTLHRDAYYRTVFEEVYQLALQGKASGVNFWAWAGEGRPAKPGTMWQKGDPFTGDPPHEPQGWYSVYDRDTSTHQVISEYAGKLQKVGKK